MSGIDYGNGQTNINHETGIRYGVIPARDVPYWADEAEADYGPPTCPECGGPAIEHDKGYADFVCPDCQYGFDSDMAYPDEPLSWDYNTDGIKASQSGDDCDIFITASPYYTLTKLCSPCAPGAGHLSCPVEYGAKTYCFPAEWFDGECPYPAYRVTDGTLIA